MGTGRPRMLGAIRPQCLFLARTRLRGVKKYRCGEIGADCGTPQSYDPGRDLWEKDRKRSFSARE
jgi:hypothetical protein